MKKNEKTQVETKGNTTTQSQPLKIDVKIGSIRPSGSLRATASVNLNDCFAIRNVKIMEGSKGLFVSMPNYKAGNGEYKDICFPITKEFRQQLHDAIISAYQQALSMSQSQEIGQDDLPLDVREHTPGIQMG